MPSQQSNPPAKRRRKRHQFMVYVVKTRNPVTHRLETRRYGIPRDVRFALLTEQAANTDWWRLTNHALLNIPVSGTYANNQQPLIGVGLIMRIKWQKTEPEINARSQFVSYDIWKYRSNKLLFNYLKHDHDPKSYSNIKSDLRYWKRYDIWHTVKSKIKKVISWA